MRKTLSTGSRLSMLPMLGLLVVPMVRAQSRAAMEAVTPSQLAQQVVRAREQVALCEARAVCNADAVGSDARVESESGVYTVHWEWLRAMLRAKPEDRAPLLPIAASRLDAMAEELQQPAAAAPQFSEARGRLDALLRQPEFAEAQPTWWQRKRLQLLMLLARLFGGMGVLGKLGVGRVLEWVLFVGAAVGLLLFVLRSFARQRSRLALGGPALSEAAWKHDAEDWARRAAESAGRGDFREALHHLYWASIVRLESRRMWRHDPTRTPREYVRLLKPASTEHTSLRQLTRLFETAWYGQAAVTHGDYTDAQRLYEGLSVGGGRPAAGEAA